MIYVSSDRKFWIRFYLNFIQVGLTGEYLQRLGPFWNYMPKVFEGNEISEGQQLAAIEAACSQVSLQSPIKGTLTSVNRLFEESPSEISEDSSLFVFSSIASIEHLEPLV